MDVGTRLRDSTILESLIGQDESEREHACITNRYSSAVIEATSTITMGQS